MRSDARRTAEGTAEYSIMVIIAIAIIATDGCSAVILAGGMTTDVGGGVGEGMLYPRVGLLEEECHYL